MILEASARENVSKNASKNVLVQECLSTRMSCGYCNTELYF